MRKLLNNRLVVAALAVAAIAFVWFSLAPTTRVQRVAVAAPVETDAQITAEPPASEAVHPSAQDALKQLALPKVPRDPFATRATVESAPDGEKKEEPDFVDTAHLSGIWTQNGVTFVLINEHVRSVGDSIGRLQIESASRDGVWLTHWKGRTFLALGKSFVLKTPVRQSGNISSQ
jgi:hypothetical protein